MSNSIIIPIIKSDGAIKDPDATDCHAIITNGLCWILSEPVLNACVFLWQHYLAKRLIVRVRTGGRVWTYSWGKRMGEPRYKGNMYAKNKKKIKYLCSLCFFLLKSYKIHYTSAIFSVITSVETSVTSRVRPSLAFRRPSKVRI